MICPKCNSEMERVRQPDVEVDRCTQCKGIWFDMLEQEDLKTLEGSEQIDIGDEKVGAKFNTATKIKCPACESRMIAMVDREQPHIKYESCSQCYGVFFDAGEFKDYKESGILESLKRLYEKGKDSSN
jgi:uncharacterized protein